MPSHAIVIFHLLHQFPRFTNHEAQNQGQRSSCLMVHCSSWVPRPIHPTITPWSKPQQLPLGHAYQSPSVECYPTRLIQGIWLDRVQAMLRWIGQLSWFLPATDLFHNFPQFLPPFKESKSVTKSFQIRASFHTEGVGFRARDKISAVGLLAVKASQYCRVNSAIPSISPYQYSILSVANVATSRNIAVDCSILRDRRKEWPTPSRRCLGGVCARSNRSNRSRSACGAASKARAARTAAALGREVARYGDEGHRTNINQAGRTWSKTLIHFAFHTLNIRVYHEKEALQEIQIMIIVDGQRDGRTDRWMDGRTDGTERQKDS